ncbi:siderophore-interacting protein [Rhodococcus sp. SORGH_AS_0303]|uniref:siderophore-interacting protein n=1 Tax=Rhodococcus sp. SORGH_AS_0303 TaxID=3041753 RepID=UPI0027801F9E|nr:siderophore-interacting protein [Rhodococcus sp. SORGH_AS_0303]MDQ1201385.1 NADPH-dependent ferric siderophore reductase [Rhodococcus sp. SORGH_AS_0303]
MARRLTTLTVLRTERLTPHMVRVVLGGANFDEFAPSEFTDSYVKLHFGDADEPTLRTYTVRSVDTQAREVAIDFVVHGDEGVAGPWALSAAAGDQLSFFGPAGAYSPRADADWHLLAGDETGVPAISAALAALPEGAVARVVLEAASPEDRVEIAAPTSADIRWVYRDQDSGGSPLAAAVRAVEWLPGQPHVFVHGEAQSVMHEIRPYIRKERGVTAEWASISGYWRRGRTEEGFRTWKRELAASES